ncbi:homocysteine methyltransferase [Candidatus Woesearchaeota archaeon]|nr:homocysteine methyltransferase [Candidatus Woesearchaeota archaeon]
MKFLKDLKKKILVVNGAMGTFFQGKYPEGSCLYELNIRNPEIVNSVQKQYLDSGCDMIEALTFNANRHNLSKYGLSEKTSLINKKAVEITKKLAEQYDEKKYVFASIGSLGQYVEPIGNIAFKESYKIYKEQISACKDADVIMLETFSEVRDLKAAILAAKGSTEKPIIVETTFEKNLRTATGSDVLTALNICESMGVDVFGINCGLRPSEMEKIVEIMVKKTNLPIIVQPNAGIPKLKDNKTVFETDPEKFAEYMEKFAKSGVNIVGACCGTTPKHIKKIRSAVKNIKPAKRKTEIYPMLSSRTKTVELKRPIIIGERINPSNRKAMSQELKENKFNILKKEAVMQSKKSDCLDVNVGIAGADEPLLMKKAIQSIQESVENPLVIDTSDIDALKKALKLSNGKVLINSVNGKKESLETILPLAKKYGAAVIGLCLDETGVARSTEKKIKIAEKIISACRKYKIPKKDIYIDCVTLAVCTDQQSAEETLKAIKKIKELEVNTVLGISNISHGLPARSILNSSFLVIALNYGLDAVIIDPLDAGMINAFNSALVLAGKDENCKRYIREVKGKTVKKEAGRKKTIEEKIQDAVYFGEKEIITDYVNQALEKYKPLEINDILIDSLKKVGKDFKCEEIFLPQVLASADAMKKAFSELKKNLDKSEIKNKGKILFATVKNDVHDIGKNIVISLLETQGYEIIDLGTNVSAEKIVKKAKEINADVLCLSALMTTTMTEMPKVIEELKKENLRIPVIVGGAVVNKEFADEIGARYSKDAMKAVEDVREVMEG